MLHMKYSISFLSTYLLCMLSVAYALPPGIEQQEKLNGMSLID